MRYLKGRTKLEHLPVTTSTAFGKNKLVAWSSGLLIEATSSSKRDAIVGLIERAIVSTDSDYASARKVAIRVPLDKNVLMVADVTSGLVAADLGLFVDITDNDTVNRGASSIDVFQVEKVISLTEGVFRVNFGVGATTPA